MHRLFPRCRPFFSFSFALALIPIAAAQSHSATDLADGLLQATTDVSTIFGERIRLLPYSLTFLANDTHAQATFEMEGGVENVGWIALGLGTKMADAAMVILWPSSDDCSNWVISHRSAGGHAMPDFNTAITASTPGRWELVPSLTSSSSSSDSSATSTSVTITRTLSLPSDQGVYPTSRLTHADLSSRSSTQKIVYAASETRPGMDTEGATLTMHTGKNFGATEVDLSERFIKEDASGGAGEGEGEEESAVAKEVGSVTDGIEVNEADGGKLVESTYSQYDYLVIAHAIFGFLAWLVVAPAGVLLARLGRKWTSWYSWHSSLQAYLTGGFTVIALALGIAAAKRAGTVSVMDSHKVFGFITFALLFIQLVVGYLAHMKSFTPSRGSTRPPVRVVHILLGVVLLLAGYITVGLGINRATTFSDKSLRALRAVYGLCIGLFLLPFLYSLFNLIRLRRREGRSLAAAALGLGRSSASPDVTVGRSWAAGLPSPAQAQGYGAGGGSGWGGPGQVEVKATREGWGKAEGDLSAWK
ncbi:hypothetical protein JCM6882_005419 [Rhodosporidiobolus microsporus]